MWDESWDFKRTIRVRVREKLERKRKLRMEGSDNSIRQCLVGVVKTTPPHEVRGAILQ